MIPTNATNMRFKDFFNIVAANEAAAHEIKGFLSANQFVMYFRFKDKKNKNEQLYGAKEDDRIAYSIIKNPRKEDPVDKYEYFGGINLESAIKDPSNMQQRLFTKEDLPNLEIIPNVEDVVKELSKVKHAAPEIPAERPEPSMFIDKK